MPKRTAKPKDTRRSYVARDYARDCKDFDPYWRIRGGCIKSLTCAWLDDMLHLHPHSDICSGRKKESE